MNQPAYLKGGEKRVIFSFDVHVDDYISSQEPFD
jgi:hypothetical protein